MMYIFRLFQVLVLAAVSLSGIGNGVFASDHIDAPSILIDGRMDVNDSYLFQSSSKTDHSVFVMTVNPLAGLLSPTTFNPSTAYDFAIDRNRDAIPDFTIRVRFSSINRLTGKQNVFVRYLYRDQDVLVAVGRTGEDIQLQGGGVLRADTFDDPFFFDLLGFQNGFNFTGMDFFEGFNVSGIVVEYPSSKLFAQNIGLVCRTLVNGLQKDRVGRPAINTVLIPSNRKDQFNQANPFGDLNLFGDDVKDKITQLSGDSNYADVVTAMLLPDLLTFNVNNSAGFLNGRRLEDDVIDAELSLLTKGAVTTDMVGSNDREFMTVFPYLAPPH